MWPQLNKSLKKSALFSLMRRVKRPPGPAPQDNNAEIYTNPDKMEALHKDHGDIIYYRMFAWPVYQFDHPDHVKHILQENARSYSKRNIDYRLLKRLGGEGLLTSNGPRWLKQRRMIQPLFSRKRIESYAPMINECTQGLLARWQSQAQHTEIFDLLDEMMELTLQIVGKALFRQDLRTFAATVGQSFETVNQTLMSLNALEILWAQVPTPRNLKLQRALHQLDQVVRQIIRTRKQELEQDPSSQQDANDLVTLLLRARDEQTRETMDETQIRDELMTMMIAGHETTANALAWTCYLLSKHPSVEERLRHQCQRVLQGRAPCVEDLPDMPLLRRVLMESMRLYPPAWALSRMVEEDDEIGGYTIPAGSIAVLCPFTTHRHPAFWDNPLEFRPERFLDEESKKRHRYAYFPFGGGQRLCIGQGFAMLEAQLILATLLQHVRLDVPSYYQAELEPLITLRPRGGIPVRLQWLH